MPSFVMYKENYLIDFLNKQLTEEAKQVGEYKGKVHVDVGIRFVIDSYSSLTTNDNLPEKVTELEETEAEFYHSLHRLKGLIGR